LGLCVSVGGITGSTSNVSADALTDFIKENIQDDRLVENIL